MKMKHDKKGNSDIFRAYCGDKRGYGKESTESRQSKPRYPGVDGGRKPGNKMKY